MPIINFVLSWVEHEKKLYNLDVASVEIILSRKVKQRSWLDCKNSYSKIFLHQLAFMMAIISQLYAEIYFF